MTAYDELLSIAVDHHGYVTVQEAIEAEIDPTVLRKLAARGRLERVSHGVYRVPMLAGGAHAAYAEAIAWTGGRAAVSHESALDLLELCDVNPPVIHLTVPRDYAPRRRGGTHYRVWRRDLAGADVMDYDGLPVVRPTAAIDECLRFGTDTSLLLQACATATREGYITEGQRVELEEKIQSARLRGAAHGD